MTHQPNVVQERFESVAAAPQEQQFATLKYGSLLVFLIGTLGSEVLGKRVTIAAPQFPNALTVLLGLVGAIVYTVVVWIALLGKFVTRGQVVTRWWVPMTVACLFAMHNMLFNLGNRGAAVPGTVTLLLTKFKIPLTMLFSMPQCTMGYVYAWTHWAGLLVLVFGIALTVNALMHSIHSDASAIGYMMLIASSDIPLAAAFVFVEKYLKKLQPQMFTVAFWMWVCLIQAPMSLMMVMFWGWFHGLRSGAVLTNVIDGMACYVAGKNTPNEPTAKCAEAQRFYLCYLLPAFASNFAMPMCTRYSTAGHLWFVRAIAVPGAAILFSLHWAMGEYATALSSLQVLGLFVVVFGVLLFNWQNPQRRPNPMSVQIQDLSEVSLQAVADDTP